MALWLEIFLALSVVLVLAGALIAVWLIIDRLRPHHSARPGEVEGEVDAPIEHHSYDVRDHGGPIVERRGPNVTESRTRDVIDRTSGDNPRL
ncbi:hypothetical protein [Ornithinimicrobium faecis]|uniref:hypothetical protein n=1 Tax=Ornithinimicrobium faecis TaxID=2934158 RepID=UPI00211770DD|nr:hypothetical protein [Ornithinimicrobium sp. HY1745]